MYEWMDLWGNGGDSIKGNELLIDTSMNWRLDEWIDKWVNVRMNELVGEWRRLQKKKEMNDEVINKFTNGWIDKCMNEWACRGMEATPEKERN